MAKAATAGTVNKEDGPPPNIDYDAVLELIQTTVHGIESDQRSLSADAKDAWDRIEGMGVNKVGAQLFSKVLKKPVEKRRDEFRTFIYLAKAAGWYAWLDDLVDRAQERPPAAAAPAAPAPPTPAPDHPGDDSDLAAGPPEERVNLKSGWIQRVKEGSRDKPTLGDEDWDDVRQATPAELAQERDRIADFDDAPSPDPAGEKAQVAAKVQARRGGRAKK